MMPAQVSGPTYILGGLADPEASRDAFWAKMMAALAVTQLIVGVSCVAFHVAAFYVDQTTNQPLHYIGEGLLTGGVIIVAGVFGLASSKRRSNCSLITFLVLSILAGLFALFPMVFGIMGATMVMGESDSLMMPISQLVLATVEIIVATWSIGVSAQAICCPNSAMAQNASRLLGGVDLPQFLSSQEGQPVVIFSSGPSQHPMMYSSQHGRVPYLMQHGPAGMQFMPAPLVATTELASDAGYVLAPVADTKQTEHTQQDTGESSSYSANTGLGERPCQQGAAEMEEDDERRKLLSASVPDKQDTEKVVVVDVPAREVFETEDEQARLLGE